jgi:fumarate reductase (CoM/CoB) subunit A
VEQIQCDVLVVGGGAAGARAALEASKTGARTCLITKGRFGEAGTSAYHVADAAGFGASGLLDPADNPEEHYRDITEAALGMDDPRLSRLVAVEAPRHLLYLESIGVPIQRDPAGNYLATRSCFSGRARSIKVKGHGFPIVDCLKKQILQRDVIIIEQAMVLEPLLDEDGRCCGALAVKSPDVFMEIGAKATILATGGAGQLFEKNLNPPDVTGDGYAFGLKAGAELVNMEFMQAGFGIAAPLRNVIFQYWLWDLKPEVFSAKGEKFLGQLIPQQYTVEEVMAAKAGHYPFSSRDISKYMEVSVQTFANSRKDLGLDETVWINLAGADERVAALPEGHNLKKMWPLSKEFFLTAGINPDTNVQLACFAHAMNGGVRLTDEFGRTGVEGLYAAGEVAGGPHGADRLGGNMFPTSQVFAERAALHGAELGGRKRIRRFSGDSELKIAALLAGEIHAPHELGRLRRELQNWSSRSLFIVREEAQLNRYIEQTEKIWAQLSRLAVTGASILNKAELQNLVLTGKAIAAAALSRKESRGSHFRSDYPELAPDWERRIHIRRNDRSELIVTYEKDR